MPKSIKITNSSDRVIETKYRMPGEKTVQIIRVQPRALLNEVNFPSEKHLAVWKDQNKSFFSRGILFENEKREALLKDAEKTDSKNISETIQNKSNKNMEDLEAAADNVNARLNIETEDLSQKKSRRKQ